VGTLREPDEAFELRFAPQETSPIPFDDSDLITINLADSETTTLPPYLDLTASPGPEKRFPAHCVDIQNVHEFSQHAVEVSQTRRVQIPEARGTAELALFYRDTPPFRMPGFVSLPEVDLRHPLDGRQRQRAVIVMGSKARRDGE
jgi:hypothetical protein